MSSTDFAYEPVSDPAGLPARIAVFADRPAKRDEILGDCTGAGFRSIDGGSLSTLLEGPIALLGDVVLVDCAWVDAECLAALSRLDMRVARSGAKLIVSTSMEALDDVFAALDQSQPNILVSPSRGDRLVAVGHVLADIADRRVRELSERDRLHLLQLSQQVEAIAHKLEGLTGQPGLQGTTGGEAAQSGPSSIEPAYEHGARTSAPARIYDSSQPGLPDARLVRRMIAARQARGAYFDMALFADPAWDMLLDLTAAHAEGQQVSVTSLCIAAGVPATTALRWIKQMVDSGIFRRIADRTDRRRAFIALSDSSLEAMSRYFADIDVPLALAA
jgi:hypothetical protein